MNYYVVYKDKNNKLSELYFTYRDEHQVVFSSDTLIRDEDDVIYVMGRFIGVQDMVIRETLLPVSEAQELYKDNLIRILKDENI